MGDTVGREKVCIWVGWWRRAGEERREEKCLEVEGCVVNWGILELIGLLDIGLIRILRFWALIWLGIGGGDGGDDVESWVALPVH